MFCPRCGQQQLNYNTRFCSQCGFLMNGMAEVVVRGGLPAETAEGSAADAESPRRKGIRQGGLLMLSSFILVPLSVMFTIMLNVEPFGVVITALLTFWGGFLRILYAAIFQSGTPTTEDLGFFQSLRRDLTGKQYQTKALPERFPGGAVSDFESPGVGKWRETNDLQPVSDELFR
ncbi:MAG: zinc ribbon domain-containing protein [Pyrinomonadaceae bacterium]